MSGHACALCDEIEPGVSFCTACNFNLCNDCWVTYPSHRKGLLGPQGLPHEKVDPDVVDDLKVCLEEPNEDNEYRLHREDEETTWFGLERDLGGDPVLAEYRRYAAIMMQASQDRQRTRYPSLVSFIGQTGAGKSSIINLLIGLSAGSNVAVDDSTRSTPVIGRSSSTTPTSADVHLYLSPETKNSKLSILYADCEGFNGGERNPIAINAVISDQDSRPEDRTAQRHKQATIVRKVSQGTKRLLKWASHDSLTYGEASKRSFTVSEMYPRIFYAFSDIIVFVLDNPKTIEVVVERLLEWADANYSKSINQPIKPHAIIALNKSNTSTPEDQWDTVNATAHLLNTANAKIDENQTFIKYAKMWRKTSLARIDSMQDLLRCYYSTVHVVRLPEKSRYQLLNRQRQQLHSVIQDCCAISYRDKQERELLTDVDEFGLYLSLAFDHFSETLDEPFDFVEASLKKNPLSNSFADNLLIFAGNFGNYTKLSGRIVELFSQLTVFVASCILLESARKQRVGRPEDWFGHLDEDNFDSDIRGHSRRSSGSPSKPKVGTYREACRRAIERYLRDSVPCAYVFNDATPFLHRQRQCEVRKEYHGTTHRVKTKFRTTDAPGHFQLSFEEDRVLEWETQVLAQLIRMQDALKRTSSIKFKETVVTHHASILPEFYKNAPGSRWTQRAKFFLNSICVVCLCNPPQHTIGCGHIICTDCARDFGTVQERTITMQVCPLCTSDCDEDPEGATTIDMLPPFSGLRILTLDGGGIRGIVELCVLKAIENCTGIPIQKCIDLVVGTSTGGIIALGLGHQMWTVDECTRHFRGLVPLAFTMRKGQDLHVIRRIQLFVKHSKYETKPFEAALKTAFDDKTRLFSQPHVGRRLKTAVVAVSSSGSNTWVLSNYNTLSHSDREILKYRRYRPEKQADEVLSWEAARATSAAPGFFKPFSLLRPDLHTEEWIDGGILHNNPIEIAIEEARRLAITECLNPVPDLVLSVGTGLSERLRERGEIPPEEKDKGPPQVKTTDWIRSLYTIVRYQIKLNTDTDRRWMQVSAANKEMDRRLYRINPDLQRDPPELDDVAEVPGLASFVSELLTTDRGLSFKILEVSAALVATSFYFIRDGAPISTSSSSTELRGRIRCRLENHDGDILGLARLISRSKAPEFVIYNEPMDADDLFIPVPLSSMIQDKIFPEIHVKITVSGDDALTNIALRLPRICDRLEFPISGFPRKLVRMDFGPKGGAFTDHLSPIYASQLQMTGEP